MLAAYTYSSGLRAPALIAFVKDTLIYIVIVVAVIYVADEDRASAHDLRRGADEDGDDQPGTGKPTGVFIPAPRSYWAYGTLALGSALALFMYPHSMTGGALRRESRNVIRRNAAILPAYSLHARPARAARLRGDRRRHQADRAGRQAQRRSWSCRSCFEDMFPSWFAGVAFAAIAIGALVPAAIMSIAAANLFTRNIYREFIKPDATPKQEAQVSKIVSLVVKFGALLFVLSLDRQNAINFQLLGGVWILQTLPGDRRSASTRAGSTGGRCSSAGRSAWSTAPSEAYGVASPATKHFGGSTTKIPVHRPDRLHRR